MMIFTLLFQFDYGTLCCFFMSFFLYFLIVLTLFLFFFFSSRRRHTRWPRDWSSDVCSSDLLNSPETPLFSKGRVLYGLFEGLAAVRKARKAVLMEGYMDVIAAHQHGLVQARSEERRIGKECRAR